eukprot:gene29314-52490_t
MSLVTLLERLKSPRSVLATKRVVEPPAAAESADRRALVDRARAAAGRRVVDLRSGGRWKLSWKPVAGEADRLLVSLKRHQQQQPTG